ncbi:RES family NAD+ phosphorylase [Ectothiorhodospira sp. BSL-9]|uniref:RES family NAD+ phosphorylase n=1 Tax=Ectothiorhodospira sp. BSL-9 TaxID=1442136 RepID=UPI0021108C11|nr:RES domain-containing protein [Ectothiorhodospira sp. BSL-9]
MILVNLPAGTILFRAHTPQWASRPTSGAGAAIQGGRFNRDGVEALYLSLDEVTALREYQQTSPFLPPCTMCSYTVTLRDLVDLRQLYRGEPWDDLWHDWRHLKFDLHIEPPHLGSCRHGVGPWLHRHPFPEPGA